MLAQPFHLGVIVSDSIHLPHVDVRGRTQDAAAQLPLQPCHQCQRNNQGQDSDGDADGREQRHA